jgi:hypothetical protein
MIEDDASALYLWREWIESMPTRTRLSGRFVRLNEAFLRQRASERHDPRHVFYKAMLEVDTYEEYAAATVGKLAETGTRKVDATSGREEILYARRNKWIADAGS